VKPLKMEIYEKLKETMRESEKRGIYDDELLAYLRRKGYDLGVSEFNKVLLSMEIEGLITVRWAGKGKRLIMPYEAG